jgi:hypothetical protein
MPNDPPNRLLPPLTPTELSSRDFQEMKLEGELSLCWNPRGEDFDTKRALDLVRAYVIVIFEMQLKVYRDRHWYSTQWIPKIIEEAISRVARCFKNRSYENPGKILEGLSNTIHLHLLARPDLVPHADYLRLFPSPPTPQLLPPVQVQMTGPLKYDDLEASAYASASPLVLLALAGGRLPGDQQQMATSQIPENVPGTSTQGASDLSEAERRENLLDEYKKATGNPSNKKIYEAHNSGIHKPEFYRWKNGVLPAHSRTTHKFEAFLKARRKPIPRKPTTEL